MRFVRAVAFPCAVALLLGGSVARASDTYPDADGRPPTGLVALGAGTTLAVLGTLSYATAPLCETGIVVPSRQSSCFTVSFVAGTPLLALGIPLIVYGAVQRAHFADWRKTHPYGDVGFAALPGGGAVSWTTSF